MYEQGMRMRICLCVYLCLTMRGDEEVKMKRVNNIDLLNMSRCYLPSDASFIFLERNLILFKKKNLDHRKDAI